MRALLKSYEHDGIACNLFHTYKLCKWILSQNNLGIVWSLFQIFFFKYVGFQVNQKFTLHKKWKTEFLFSLSIAEFCGVGDVMVCIVKKLACRCVLFPLQYHDMNILAFKFFGFHYAFLRNSSIIVITWSPWHCCFAF